MKQDSDFDMWDLSLLQPHKNISDKLRMVQLGAAGVYSFKSYGKMKQEKACSICQCNDYTTTHLSQYIREQS